MHTSREIESAGKRRLRRSGRRGRALLAFRHLGIEQLEDRRVLSGISPVTAPALYRLRSNPGVACNLRAL